MPNVCLVTPSLLFVFVYISLRMAASNVSWKRRSQNDKFKLSDSNHSGFHRYLSQLRSLVYRNTDEFYNQLGDLLVDINGLDFSDPDVCQSEEVCGLMYLLSGSPRC